MKKILILAIFLVACTDSKQTAHKECPSISVKFSPRGGVTQAIVNGIDETKSDVRIQAFSFTSMPIAEALVKAKKNGKQVEAVLDRENLHNKNSVISYLYENDISIYIDDRHAIAHNKIIIIDNKIVFTGSANFSRGAEEHNAENSVMISDAQIAKAYLENYELHKDHSYAYHGE